jgi:hypothetical protein
MRVSLVATAAAASLAGVALAVWLLDLSFERAALLAPVLVLCAGAAVGLLVLWVKAALEPFRHRRR